MVLSELGQIAKKLWYKIPNHFRFVKLDEFTIMPDHLHGIIIINDKMSLISPKTGSLGSVIRSYKSAVSKNIHQINPDFSWQTRFYDHIIRTGRELNRIRNYIVLNPQKYKD